VTFDLGVNIRHITKLVADEPGILRITGTKDTYDNDSDEVRNIPFEATVRYREVAQAFTVTAETGGSATTVVKHEDQAAQFLSRVSAMTDLDQGDVNARVFQVGGGDPALNGNHVFLSLMTYPEERTYDLGLNVASVTKVSFAGNNDLRVEGSEDYPGQDGSVAHRPFSARIIFKVTDGAPSESIGVTH